MKKFLLTIFCLLAIPSLLYMATRLDSTDEVLWSMSRLKQAPAADTTVTVPSTESPAAEPPATEPVTEPVTEPAGDETLIFTFVGDCTLGGHTEHTHAGYGFLKTVMANYDYPFANVKTWFETDDLTFANLEGPLTDQGVPSGHRYSFRGPSSNVNILTRGSVDMVTLANNHSLDYGQVGYAQTQEVLEENSLPYVEANSSTVITLENGVTVGVYATVYNSIDEEQTIAEISALKSSGIDVVIYAPHWGVENTFLPTQQQLSLGRAAIEAGADIVWGSHPHVLQPIEEYKDGIIYYSLGNFSFGGNIYPKDFDTVIIQQELTVSPEGGVTLGRHTLIPCSISSIPERNNFQPTPYEEGSEEYDRVLDKLAGCYSGSNLPVG